MIAQQIDQQIAEATARANYYAGQVAALQQVRAQIGGQVAVGREVQSNERVFGFAQALQTEEVS